MDSSTMVEQKVERVVLILYVPSRDRFDTFRSEKIQSLESEAEGRGFKFNTLRLEPEKIDEWLLTHRRSAEQFLNAYLSSEHAKWRCSLSDIYSFWFAGQGTCQFARHVFWYAYTNHHMFEDKMERGNSLRKFLNMYRDSRNRELNRSEPSLSGLLSG